MDLKDIMSISGMSGLFRMEAQRDNGIIVRPLGEGPRKFIPARQHLFTPLDNITIYTDDPDGMGLAQVFLRMKEKSEDVPPIAAKSDNNTLHDYFEEVVPEYDAERVYPSDIKKILKWYQSLDEAGLVVPADDAGNEQEEEE